MVVVFILKVHVRSTVNAANLAFRLHEPKVLKLGYLLAG